jgi:cysteine desulfuration protein SufE
LIAILLALYSGEIARDILTTDPSALFERLGLREYLTPQRSNGLKSMVARIRAEAQTVLTPPIDPVVSALDRCRRFRVIQGGVR